MPPDVNK